jgi:hypothetical protein
MTISRMARILVVALFVVVTANSLAATPASIEVLRPNRTYLRGASCDLKTVDFRNFSYFTGEWMSASHRAWPDDPVRVSKGKYSFRDGGFEDISVTAVLHPSVGSAVVSLWQSYGGGSSNQELVVMVFQCVDGRLKNTQLIRGDGHGYGAGVTFSDGGKEMTMSSVYDYTAAQCCPRYLETAVFRLAKRGYVVVATNQKENHYPR